MKRQAQLGTAPVMPVWRQPQHSNDHLEMKKYLLAIVSALAILAAYAPAHPGPSGIAQSLFVQKGTGAAPRMYSDKLSEQVSVTDYGAIGNGITDDAPAFRKAIVYLMARGGGTVVVPSGSYFLNSFDPTPLSTDEYVAFNVEDGHHDSRRKHVFDIAKIVEDPASNCPGRRAPELHRSKGRFVGRDHQRSEFRLQRHPADRRLIPKL
jgi:hypothetical protein